MRANKKNLSAVEPSFYKKRFQRFMRSQVFIQTKTMSSLVQRKTNVKATALIRKSHTHRTTSTDIFQNYSQGDNYLDKDNDALSEEAHFER